MTQGAARNAITVPHGLRGGLAVAVLCALPGAAVAEDAVMLDSVPFEAATDTLELDRNYTPFESHGFTFDGGYEIGVAGEGSFSAANTVPHAGVNMRVGWGTQLDSGLKLNFEFNFGLEHSTDGWVIRPGGND
ncbi:MAG: hypothetical protein NXH79_01535 [Rhodobacteraceae bacterium]|nr:hypothetical protein [Paracoccaceae bacterium]